MADYHAILKRAISALPAPNGEARRAVYEKARAALVNQLKAFDPPLSPSEITQQRLQLEEAIRKVESEAAKGLLKPTPAAPPVRPPEPSPTTDAAKPAEAGTAEAGIEPGPSREAPPSVPGATAPTAALKSVVDEAGQLGGPAAELGRQARDALADAPAETPPPSFGREVAEPPRKREAADRRKRREAVVHGEKPPSRLPVVIGLGAAIIVFVIGIVALWSQREAISAFFGGRGEKITDIATRKSGDKLAPKATDRLGSDEAGKPASNVKPVPTQTITATPQLQNGEATKSNDAPPPKQAVALVAQKAILYEEGKAGAPALISQGKVVWQVAPDPTVARDGAVILRVRAEIPERKMVVNLSMRPNEDASFPASHLVEIKFQLPPDFDGKAVTGIPGLIMKATEQSRGDPLNAASAKVADNFFWIALGAAEADKERNFKLLKERGWIDVPILYDNGRRGILTLEKSGAGDTALSDALTAWGQGG
ncbi:MAG: hypothetical protein LWW93_16285 [Hyphomicrobiales bacterium]|nr:hypothetical protein [Hyphomicrobiales bacterium]